MHKLFKPEIRNMKKIFIVFSLFFAAFSMQLAAQGDNCSSAVQIISNGTYTADGPSSGGGATQLGATNADWYYFVAPSAGQIEVSACNLGNTDTRLHIYDGSCIILNQLGTDDDGCTSYAYASFLSGIVVSAGTTYYIEWDDRWSPSSFQFTFTFTVFSTCPQPTALSVSNITTTSADLSWTEVATASLWNIEYDIAGFTLGSGSQITSISSNPYNLAGLTTNTAYEFYVQSDCGGGDTSDWTGPFQFNTNCLTITAPYFENFENAGFIPSCWNNDANDDFDWSFGQNTPSGSTGPSGDHTTGSGYFAYTEASYPNNPNKEADLLSPWINISGLSVPALHFWYHMYGNSMGSLHMDINDGSSWTNDVFQISGNQGTIWNDVYVNLSSYGDSVQIRFRGITGGNAYSDMAIDDFSIDEMPSCPDPMNLSISTIQTNSVEITWLEIGTATNWKVQYGLSGFALGSGTIAPTSNNPHTQGGLIASTSYHFYVQSDCGAGDTSNWIGPLAITTACDVYTAPYSEDFENSGSIPLCWINDIGDDINWSFGQNTPSVNTGPDSDHTTGSGYFAYTEASQPNYPDKQADLLSPWIDKSGLSNPALMFWYHLYGANMGSLHVDINDGSGWVNDVFQISGDQGNLWTQMFIDLSPFADTIQARFRGITGSFAYSDMAIDDILIDEMPSCPPPTQLTITNLSDTSASLGWTEIGGATLWNIEYGLAGFTQGTGNMLMNISSNPYTIINLLANTDYQFYVQSYCGVGDSSSWSGPRNFTTYIAPLSNPSACEVNIEIPDNSCVDIPISVNNTIGNQLGTTIEVSDVNIIFQHQADMDLRITLESPNGVIIDLSIANGGNQNDYGIIDGTCTQYTNFNMTGTDGPITGGVPPFVGSFIPEGDFADFNDNSNPNGLWILHVCDNWAPDTGSVQYVEIIFNSLIPPADVIINEIDCDQASDTLEFIELYDGGVGNYPLNGYAIAFYDGSSDQIYYSVDLDGYSTDSSGYFVIGNNAISQAGINFSNGLLQNGADAVALYFDDASNLSPGTALTVLNLSDAIVYATNDPVDVQLLALLNMGQPQINEDNLGNKNMHSCSRLPNGSGGARNTITYEAAIPTPGAINNAIPNMLWDSVLTESLYNNGSIGNTLHIDLEDAEFAILGTLIENTHYTISNVPAGLNAEINTTSDSTAEISLLGYATSHLDADDINNLSVEFLDAAYLQYAYYVENDSKSDIHVDFFDNTPKTLVWDTDTFYENILNDGSIGNDINLLLFADTFSIIGTLTETVHYNVSNVPNGLSAIITTLTDSTASIELTGNALSHFNSDDINNLSITFLDVIFTGGSAITVANYRDTNLVVDFTNQLSDSTNILSYSFPQQTGSAIINATNHTVYIEVSSGTLLNALTATFTLSNGASTTISSAPQISGTTVNDFTSNVVYNVLAEDGSTNQDWTIYVSIATSIQDIEDPFKLNIYPNPSSSYFIIEVSSNGTKDFIMEIFNLNGQILHQEIFNNRTYIHYKYNCDKLSKGVYYIKIGTNELIRVEKIIIQ